MLRNDPGGAAGTGDSLDPAELAAAEWLLRHDEGLTPDQEREFSRWSRADERNARIYARLEQTWGLLDRVPAVRFPMRPCHTLKWVWVSGALAAAAAVTVAFVMPRLTPRSADLRVESAMTPIGGYERINLPDGSIVALNTASEVEFAYTSTERRVRLVRGEANFSVAADKSRPFVVRVGQVDVRAVGTAFNVRRHRDTIEVLVTEGNVRVDDVVSGKSLLARSAESNVASRRGLGDSEDTALPTIAQDGKPASIRPGHAAVAVPGIESPVLSAGQRATIAITEERVATVAEVLLVAPDEAARALAWQSRRLEFSAEPLETIVAEFNRHNRHQLLIADAELRRQRFGGKFPADDFESLVRLLEANFGVVVERHENKTVLRGFAAARP